MKRERIAKDFPTEETNPDDLLSLQGYQGETYREIVTASKEKTYTKGNPYLLLHTKKDDAGESS